ncbi:DUF2723 domain-containing protein, partial [Candidatus Roizmanbacteria bacterium]|nr:DUF2723 domain-containing protein [Candidatus Roizmanbacteria bacterium]
MFFIPLTLYVFTLAPSVTFGDSGELITAAYYLGISHPPGSPLWTLLAKLFTFIPLNSVAWRVNFSSAFFSAFASSLFFIVLASTAKLLELKLNKLLAYSIAFVTTLLFAFSRTTWTISVMAEVWSLNNVLFCLLLLSLYGWLKTKKNIYLYLSAFISGLGLTNHYLFLIVLPPLIIWVLLNDFRLVKNFKLLFISFIFFLAGLSFYFYLPLRAQTNPVINWGNPSTLQRLSDYLQRKQFGSNFQGEESNIGVYLPITPLNSVSDTISRIFSSFFSFSASLLYELPAWFLISAFVGITFFFIFNRHNKNAFLWAILTIFFVLFSGWGFSFLTNAPQPRSNTFFTHYLFAFLTIHIWFFIAVVWLTEKLARSFGKLIVLAFIFVNVLLLISQINSNFKIGDWSRNEIAYEHGMNILNTVDKNSIIIADKNNSIFPLLYLKTVEGKRPDVTLYDRSGNLFDQIYDVKTIAIRSF